MDKNGVFITECTQYSWNRLTRSVCPKNIDANRSKDNAFWNCGYSYSNLHWKYKCIVSDFKKNINDKDKILKEIVFPVLEDTTIEKVSEFIRYLSNELNMTVMSYALHKDEEVPNVHVVVGKYNAQNGKIIYFNRNDTVLHIAGLVDIHIKSDRNATADNLHRLEFEYSYGNLQDTLISLMDKIEVYRGHFADLSESVKNLKYTKSCLNSEIDHLKRVLDKNSESYQSFVQYRESGLEQKAEDLKEEYDRLLSQIRCLESRESEINSTIDSLNIREEILRDDIDALKDKKKSILHSILSDKTELKDLELRLSMLNNDIASKSMEIDTLAELQTKNAGGLFNKKYRKKILNLKHENDDLKAKLIACSEQIENAADKFNQLGESYDLKCRECDDLEAQVTSLKTESEQLSANFYKILDLSQRYNLSFEDSCKLISKGYLFDKCDNGEIYISYKIKT